MATFDEFPSASSSARRRLSNPTRRRGSLMQDLKPTTERSPSGTRRGSNPPGPPLSPSATGPSFARSPLPTQQEHSRSESKSSDEETDAMTVRSTLMPQHAMRAPSGTPGDPPPPYRAPVAPRLQRVSISPGLSPIPVSSTFSATATMPLELLPLPQDPNHILPLSTPPPASRESLDYVAQASSGHGSTPRTSMSLSEEMSWGTGNRSYSDSSAGDDDDCPTASSGWWKRSHGRGPSVQSMRRPATSRLPFGTRQWAWLLGPFKPLTRPYDYMSLVDSTIKRGRSDREQIYATTTRRKSRTLLGSQYLAYAVDWVQSEPWAVVLFLFVFAIFSICLGCGIKYVLDPDKAALPWREYASLDYPTIFSIQDADWDNSALGGHLPPLSALKPVTAHHSLWPYPGHDYAPHQENMHGRSRVDDLEPTTVFIAVFTYDVGVDRRNLIRQSYASHPRSRTPGTEGVRLRFVMGRPRPQFKQMVDAEMEEYKDIVVLDMDENMNDGKTHKFISWAADHAIVPDYEYPSHPRSEASAEEFVAQREAGKEAVPIYRGEKKPDYIVKADDDSFIMLGEFERHLRVTRRTKTVWGYLVRERFMAGECYALSRDLAEYIRDTEELRDHVEGKEDKLVSQWLRTHPDKEEILWYSERTWIYDHPKSGTVYAHGFLFPDEVARVRAERLNGLSDEERIQRTQFGADMDAYSTVSQFGKRYRPPLRGLSFDEATETLVEGSPMSRLRTEAVDKYAHSRADMAARVDALMASRPRLEERYLGAERGGTVVVHYIKRREWFEETGRVLLGEN
ncbi:uncharacterized protein CcaverHIS019_0112290 [Cutaneotrichosporon cavernicola]|uniref:Glycosyltransferase family 31 protein n=1 Tax=Cutaneotrichosporon cavernicola TaxID=279322 RepID=A0AA48HZV5_9TREE|nr:uncharacterized protein CcaverHIS019_0112290 [Cutaneotrichosporon cavernicola]BEI88511.1 hypothetical protein CcaverHIS019_0112290 [Cutaneotrichosporon cavernicola]